MNVIIHRGQNQIGGNIIEITAENTRILLDVGLELDQEEGTLPEIDGLFDHPSFDAVFISHYHGDHLGLAYYIDNRICISGRQVIALSKQQMIIRDLNLLPPAVSFAICSRLRLEASPSRRSFAIIPLLTVICSCAKQTVKSFSIPGTFVPMAESLLIGCSMPCRIK